MSRIGSLFFIKLLIIKDLFKAQKESAAALTEYIENMFEDQPYLARDIRLDLEKYGLYYYILYLVICLVLYVSSIYYLSYLIIEDLPYFTSSLVEGSLLLPLLHRPSNVQENSRIHGATQLRKYSSNNFDSNHKLPVYPLNQWCSYSVPIEDNEYLTGNILSLCILEFFSNVLNTLTDNQCIQVTIKIKYVEDNDVISYRSLTALQTFRNVTSDRVEYLTIATGKLDLKSNYYLCTNVEKVTFIFRVLEKTPDMVLPIFDRRHQLKEKRVAQKYTFAGYNLPLPSTMDYRYFGHVVIEDNNIIIIKGHLGYTFRITRRSDCNIIQILPKNSTYSNIDILLNNVTTVQVVSDYPSSGEDSYTFRREVDNVTYHFQKGELSSRNQIRKTSFIKPIVKNKRIITNKLLTLDIETTSEEVFDEKTGKLFSVLKVYLISIYDGKKATSFYIDDFKNEVELINSVISFLLSGPYNNKVVYVHNLSKFDSVFLIKYLATSKDCYMDKPLMKDGRFIQITIKVGDVEPYTLKFMDSLQMLPQSLKSLAKQFNVEEKGLFPVLMPIPEKGSTYSFPDFEYFDKITLDEYIKFKSEFKGD